LRPVTKPAGHMPAQDPNWGPPARLGGDELVGNSTERCRIKLSNATSQNDETWISSGLSRVGMIHIDLPFPAVGIGFAGGSE
jgi:hypothetical protein